MCAARPQLGLAGTVKAKNGTPQGTRETALVWDVTVLATAVAALDRAVMFLIKNGNAQGKNVRFLAKNVTAVAKIGSALTKNVTAVAKSGSALGENAALLPKK